METIEQFGQTNARARLAVGQNKGLKIYAWCLMTNHVHLIIQKGESCDLSEILRDLKKNLLPRNSFRL